MRGSGSNSISLVDARAAKCLGKVTDLRSQVRRRYRVALPDDGTETLPISKKEGDQDETEQELSHCDSGVSASPVVRDRERAGYQVQLRAGN